MKNKKLLLLSLAVVLAGCSAGTFSTDYESALQRRDEILEDQNRETFDLRHIMSFKNVNDRIYYVKSDFELNVVNGSTSSKTNQTEIVYTLKKDKLENYCRIHNINRVKNDDTGTQKLVESSRWIYVSEGMIFDAYDDGIARTYFKTPLETTSEKEIANKFNEYVETYLNDQMNYKGEDHLNIEEKQLFIDQAIEAGDSTASIEYFRTTDDNSLIIDMNVGADWKEESDGLYSIERFRDYCCWNDSLLVSYQYSEETGTGKKAEGKSSVDMVNGHMYNYSQKMVFKNPNKDTNYFEPTKPKIEGFEDITPTEGGLDD